MTLRFKIEITGLVQGVGFRPFVFRTATNLHLTGWIKNTERGVLAEIEGAQEALNLFFKQLETDLPPQAQIYTIQKEEIPNEDSSLFEILHSHTAQKPDAVILNDLALCDDCLKEMNDPTDRRYRYPFITCTNCGPRYTIMTALPYDRPHTTMHNFPLCDDCRKEYEDPHNRRFHAQPLACPKCGPHITLWDKEGNVTAKHDNALKNAVEAVQQGKIIAMKGLGGFHLICDANNSKAIETLRLRKNRPAKPFAIMCPNLNTAQNLCDIDQEEKKLLTSTQAPIVLLKKKKDRLAKNLAPNNPYLGVMLPYTPLHHLFLQAFSNPIVATSGNRANEPICTNEHEALDTLKDIADLFLIHNRPIAHRADDSIVRIIQHRPMMLRRARGFAPLPFRYKETHASILSVGGHLKNSVALAMDDKIMTGPHIGNLETIKACEGHQDSVKTLCHMYDVTPDIIAHDLHPDYTSTKLASETFPSTQKRPIQHHYAHALACMADNQLDKPCLAAVWDGTGFGTNGTIWGGEFLKITNNGYERAGHLLPFPLPGGDLAAKEPRRAALGLLYSMEGNSAFDRVSELFTTQELSLLKPALSKGLNCPMTSSMGRLFDGVSALLGLCTQNSFEGEAAMQLEFIADEHESSTYPFEDPTDWRPLLRAILEDKDKKINPALVSARFHNTLVNMLVAFAKKTDEKDILLTGGCFQNKVLSEKAIEALRSNGLTPHWHKDIPPNDGGIAIGQCIATARALNKKG